MTDFAFLWDTLTRLLTGVPLTLKLASGSVALGAVLALMLVAREERVSCCVARV